MILLGRVHDRVGATEVERNLGVRITSDFVRFLQRCGSASEILASLMHIEQQRIDAVQRVLVLLNLAVDLLFQQINGAEPDGRTYRIGARLVERASCAAMRRNSWGSATARG